MSDKNLVPEYVGGFHKSKRVMYGSDNQKQ
jgi:hypothetical protein